MENPATAKRVFIRVALIVPVLVAILFIPAGTLAYWEAWIYLAFRENEYASRTVQVEQGQRVISSGPYALVRHPMYVGTAAMYLASPLALGSYWAVLPALLIVPILVARIVSEEKVLERNLPGYREYCQRTRYRLVPGIW